MIIKTNRKYNATNIMNLMSDLVATRLQDCYKIDFEQQLYIRDCSSIEKVINETYIVQTNYLESVVTYIVGDFDDPDGNILIMERHFEPGAIDDVTFPESKAVTVAKFQPNMDGTYSLKGFRFNL